MKFNIEVELDWIGEDQGIDDAVTSEIKSAVVDKITKTLTESTMNAISKQVNETVISNINAKVDEVYERVLNAPMLVTDNWGETKEHYESLESAVKQRFDKWMTARVDKYGKETTYSSSGTRVQYIIDQRIEEHAQKFTKTAIEKVEETIKTTIEQKLKDHVSEKIVDMVGLTKFIEDQKKLKK